MELLGLVSLDTWESDCWPTHVEEVKLIISATDSVGEQEHIALEPGNLLAGIFETNTGAAHCEVQR